MISTLSIIKRFKDAIRISIGEHLHQIQDSEGNSLGAVYWAKQARSTGPYPFVLVDVATRRPQNSWATSVYYNSEGNKVTKTVYDYFITLAFYGDDAMSLASQAEFSFVTDEVLNVFCKGSFASVAETFPITSGTTKRDNEYKDFASFIVKITIADTYEESVDSIETVSSNLKLKLNPFTQVESDLVSSRFVFSHFAADYFAADHLTTLNLGT